MLRHALDSETTVGAFLQWEIIRIALWGPKLDSQNRCGKKPALIGPPTFLTLPPSVHDSYRSLGKSFFFLSASLWRWRLQASHQMNRTISKKLRYYYLMYMIDILYPALCANNLLQRYFHVQPLAGWYCMPPFASLLPFFLPSSEL